MSRVPPSREIAQRVAEFMENGVSSETDVTSALVRLGVQRLLQEML